MAKTTVAPATHTKQAPAAVEEEETKPVVISTKTRRLIEGVTEPFRSFATGYSRIMATRASLAPRFMKAYDAWNAETNGSFIDFVRVIEPTVPTDREGYRANTFYQSADYLRRLVALNELASQYPTQGRRATAADAARPVPALEAMARLVTTISPFIDDLNILWEAFLQELHWPERRVNRLRRLIDQEHPAPLLQKRGQKLRLAAA